MEEILKQIKIIEPPESVELFKDKRQAFIAGQMNMYLRLMELTSKKPSDTTERVDG